MDLRIAHTTSYAPRIGISEGADASEYQQGNLAAEDLRLALSALTSGDDRHS